VNDVYVAATEVQQLLSRQRWNRVRILTRPDPTWSLSDYCEANPGQRLDSSISYLSGNPNRLVA